MHANISSSQTHGATTPESDPCTVWLENTRVAEGDSLFTKLREALDEFNIDLKQIMDLSKDLHLHVLHPGNSVEGSSGRNRKSRNIKVSFNNQHRNSGDNSKADATHPPQMTKRYTAASLDALPGISEAAEIPALPVSLFRSFENIMALFSIHSQVIEAKAGGRDIKSRGPRGHRSSVEREYLATRTKVMGCLERSKENLILNLVRQNNNSIGLGAVGSEYIAAMIVSNLQSGVFHLGTESLEVPQHLKTLGTGLNQGRRRRTAIKWEQMPEQQDIMQCSHDGSIPRPSTQITSLDHLALYAEHARALSFSASIDPRRRVFRAIRAVDEDLKAIKQVCEMQQHCLENMIRFTDPKSFRVTNKERQARFSLENALLSRLKAEKIREMRDVEDIRHGLADLRQTVIDSIEVLDEGHSKAIRVFTLVTLFFLPL